MNKKPIYVAFSTQKGGGGKTTLTVLVASYLHFVKDHNVAIVDCDYPQHSIREMRERDLKLATEDEFYREMAYEQFSRIGKKAYPVVGSSLKDAITAADKLGRQNDIDFIFFDLPGTMNNPDIIEPLLSLDYIVVPIAADRVVMESTLNFLNVVNLLRESGEAALKEIYMLWNMVDGRERTELYDVYKSVVEAMGLPILDTVIPDSKRFRKEQSISHKALFRSTLFPADRSLVRGSNLDALVNELLQVLK